MAALDWYIARSTSAATGFLRDVESALQRIAEAPNRYPQTHFGARRFVMLNYPFDLVYRVLSAETEIIAVAHHARRPGYWRNR